MRWGFGSGGGGGGGGGASLPAATVANSVVQMPVGGPAFSGPLSLDQIGAAYAVSLAGGGYVDVGTVLATPALTASYSATPTSAILNVATLAGGATATGNTSKDVTSTPTAFTAPGTYTHAGHGSSVTWSLSAHTASSPTKSASTASLAVNKHFWGLGDPDMGLVKIDGSSTGRSAATVAAFILALSTSALATSAAFTVALTAPAGKKMYAARRSAFGGPAVFTDTSTGFKGGWSLVASAVPVTRNGITENFDMYETNAAGLGAFSFGVA
jgi:hypothetical protein